MFTRNGEVFGSVLASAVPGAKPSKAKVEPEVEGSTGEVLDDAVVEVVDEPEAKAAPKKAPAKKAAPAFKSVLDDED